MFKVEFEIRHEGCLVNELSRALPDIRLICPGGFILGASSVAELIVVDSSSDEDVGAVMDFLEGLPEVERVELLERNDGKAFIYFKSLRVPKTFCSQVVEKNHGFRIGMEIQEDGLEKWTVGCVERSDAEQLLSDLAALGELARQSITEGSWQALLDGERIEC